MLESLDISLKDIILNKEEGQRLSSAWSPVYETLRNHEEQEIRSCCFKHNEHRQPDISLRESLHILNMIRDCLTGGKLQQFKNFITIFTWRDNLVYYFYMDDPQGDLRF